MRDASGELGVGGNASSENEPYGDGEGRGDDDAGGEKDAYWDVLLGDVGVVGGGEWLAVANFILRIKGGTGGARMRRRGGGGRRSDLKVQLV